MDNRVWVPVDGWSLGQIVSDTKFDVVVVTDDGKEHTVDKKKIVPVTDDNFNIETNLIRLNTLNEPVIMYNLCERYMSDEIYTYIGPMIVSVNPFQKLNIYDNNLMRQYSQAASLNDLPPHLFATAQQAFSNLTTNEESQSVIISGESGAGKTEATKIILRFLTNISKSSADVAASIIATNPILEAFGNAKTIRNNNSSRFGKLIKIHYSNGGKILGASIRNYLLENTRIVAQAADERNYHIFYTMYHGMSSTERQSYGLDLPITEYAYLSNGDMRIAERDDKRDLKEIMEAFKQLGIAEDEVTDMLRIVSAVLNLGNIVFRGETDVQIENMDQLEVVASLLEVDSEALNSALTIRMLQSGGRKSAYTIPLNAQQAIENRDSMAKTLYSRVFDYLVERINVRLQNETSDKDKFIAVLDIYGFEMFQNNSLEQLCINYANEKLHEQFNHHLFKVEQEEYSKEGVPWADIKFIDNLDCIKLIEDKGGIIEMINEEVKLPKGSDKDLLFKIEKNHGKNPFVGFKPLKKDVFEIVHYAGRVPYTVWGFVEKNRNQRNASLDSCMYTSQMPLIKDQLFAFDEKTQQQAGGQSANAIKITVLQRFKADLVDLFKILNSSFRHYVRTIKPNDLKKPHVFDGNKVLEQLRSNGILETVKLRKAGYAQKFPFKEFVQRYFSLGFDGPHRDDIEVILGISDYLNPKTWFVGRTKVFLMTAAFTALETERNAALARVLLKLQGQIRIFNAKKEMAHLAEIRRVVRRVQARIRGYNAKRLLIRKGDERRSAIVLQKYILCFWAVVELKDRQQEREKERERQKRERERERERELQLQREREMEEEEERYRKQEEKSRAPPKLAARDPTLKRNLTRVGDEYYDEDDDEEMRQMMEAKLRYEEEDRRKNNNNVPPIKLKGSTDGKGTFKDDQDFKKNQMKALGAELKKSNGLPLKKTEYSMYDDVDFASPRGQDNRSPRGPPRKANDDRDDERDFASPRGRGPSPRYDDDRKGGRDRAPPREKEREKEKLSLLFGKLWSDDPDSEPINNGPEALKYSLDHDPLNKTESGTVAIITGGTQGIGLALCMCFAKAGYTVVGTGRSNSSIDKALAQINDLGGSRTGPPIDYQVLDVTKADSVTQLLNYVTKTYGRCDVLVNNAAIWDKPKSPITETVEQMKPIVDVNSFGPIRCMQAFLPMMKKKNSGRIINMTCCMSQLRNMDQNSTISYSLSKASLNIVSKIYADEIRQEYDNIKINCYDPGFVKTKLNESLPDTYPRKYGMKWRSAQDVAQDVLWMAKLRKMGPNGLLVTEGRNVGPWTS